MSLYELGFSLSVKRLRSYPAIEPRHLVGSLKERLWRGRIPPSEDLASDNTQQDGQQQTGSRAKGGGNSNSHSNPLLASWCQKPIIRSRLAQNHSPTSRNPA